MMVLLLRRRPPRRRRVELRLLRVVLLRKHQRLSAMMHRRLVVLLLPLKVRGISRGRASTSPNRFEDGSSREKITLHHGSSRRIDTLLREGGLSSRCPSLSSAFERSLAPPLLSGRTSRRLRTGTSRVSSSSTRRCRLSDAAAASSIPRRRQLCTLQPTGTKSRFDDFRHSELLTLTWHFQFAAVSTRARVFSAGEPRFRMPPTPQTSASKHPDQKKLFVRCLQQEGSLCVQL